jgi:hypothetical protein
LIWPHPGLAQTKPAKAPAAATTPSSSTDTSAAPAKPKNDPPEFQKTLGQIKDGVSAAKTFIEALTKDWAGDAARDAKVKTLDSIREIINKTPPIDATSQKTLKERADELAATLAAIDAVKTYLTDHKSADVLK